MRRQYQDPNYEPKARRAVRLVRWRGMDMALIHDTSVRGSTASPDKGYRWVVECLFHGQTVATNTYYNATVDAHDRSRWCDGDGDEHPEDAYSWERLAAEGR